MCLISNDLNKCVVYGCKSGYYTKHEKVHGFYFPFNKPDLLAKLIKFVNRCDWKPTKNSVVCIEHFKDEFIIRGQRMKLNWEMQPVPTIHTEKALKRPSTLPNAILPRKAPRKRNNQVDQINSFEDRDLIQ